LPAPVWRAEAEPDAAAAVVPGAAAVVAPGAVVGAAVPAVVAAVPDEQQEVEVVQGERRRAAEVAPPGAPRVAEVELDV
jgi:hypothetical protein